MIAQNSRYGVDDHARDPTSTQVRRFRLRRTCYDKPHRCPGWAGGGWKYPTPRRDVCSGGSLSATMYEGRWWQFRFHRCASCGTWALPPVTRWLDPTWLWWFARVQWARRKDEHHAA